MGLEELLASVFEAVDRMAIRLGRRPDVMIVDADGVGMAGFYRR